MPGWRLTIRHGSQVRKEEFVQLDEALRSLRTHAGIVARAGPLSSAQGFREYAPHELVAARLSISNDALARRREAGVDVMGDGALVPYAGTIRKRRLEARTPDQALAAVEGVLR